MHASDDSVKQCQADNDDHILPMSSSETDVQRRFDMLQGSDEPSGVTQAKQLKSAHPSVMISLRDQQLNQAFNKRVSTDKTPADT